MQEFQEDFYAILGVEDSASPEDIRKAYLKLAKRLHPDRFPNDPEKRSAAQAEFSKVTRAHEVLGDARQREEYDAIRQLAKNRAALEAGIPGAVVPAAGSPPAEASGQATAELKGDTRDTWAGKHFARAQDCFQKKRFQEAETALKEAIRLTPNVTKFHCLLAQVYVARGWKTLAKMEIEAALRIDPKDSDAKNLELKLRAAEKGKRDEKKGGFLDQLKQMLGKKG